MRQVTPIVGVLLATLVGARAGTAADDFSETRIRHRDGSGRATVVEVDPSVPGARDFVEGVDRPAPARGELSLPSPTPRAVPSPAPGRDRGR